MTKAAIYEKFLHQQIGLDFKKKLVRFWAFGAYLCKELKHGHFRKVTNTLKVLTRGAG